MQRWRGAQALSCAALSALRGSFAQAGASRAEAVRTGSCWIATRTFAEAAPAAASSQAEAGEMAHDTQRTGVIAVKVGMTQEWDNWGVRLPLSVLWIDGCKVVQVKTDEKEGYTALQVGCGAKRPKQVTGTLRGHYAAAGVPVMRRLAEFRVTPDAVLAPGTDLGASLFVPGQYVDVVGTTIGKGFAGVMKKWGFAGGPASHGNSLAHRTPGSTGSNQDPGKVWKGKKMPGRMGGERRTVQNCLVYKVDAARNLVYVVGQVPGHKGNFVLVSDAVKKSFDQQPPRPLAPPPAEDGSEVQTLKQRGTHDPYAFQD